MKTAILTAYLPKGDTIIAIECENELQASKIAKIRMIKDFGNFPYSITFNNHTYHIPTPFRTN